MTRDEARAHFAQTLTPDQRISSPLYAALCDSTATDHVLVDLLLAAPPPQRRPVLLLAALHELALTDASGDLSPWYPTAQWLTECGGLDGPASTPPSRVVDDPALGVEAVRQACRTYEPRLHHLLATKSTQTNEVGRSGVLAFAQRSVARSEPFGLIDLGCSAGLNLVPDTYRIEAGDGTVLGDPSSPVLITPTWHAGQPDHGRWEITWQVGIEPEPIDLSSDDDARWLMACQWPDDLVRFERTRRAIQQWRTRAIPPQIIVSDARHGLELALSASSPEELVIIQQSWMAAYLSNDEQQELAASIRSLGAKRRLIWLWLEHAREVPGFDPPRPRSPRIPGSSLVVAERIGEPPRVLAQSHPHGTWAAWEESVGI